MAGKNKKSKEKKKSNPKSSTICKNRKARHEFEIIDEMECGIVLFGSEVKSIRDGNVSIEESYAHMKNGELWLLGCHINEYPQANVMNHIPRRERKLLLHKKELRKFAETATQKGLTLVPMAMYFTRGIVKVKIAIARGRKLHDKREKMKKKHSRPRNASSDVPPDIDNALSGKFPTKFLSKGVRAHFIQNAIPHAHT